jgi:hypothetical protein
MRIQGCFRVLQDSLRIPKELFHCVWNLLQAPRNLRHRRTLHSRTAYANKALQCLHPTTPVRGTARVTLTAEVTVCRNFESTSKNLMRIFELKMKNNEKTTKKAYFAYY